MPKFYRKIAYFLIFAFIFNGCASFKPVPMPELDPKDFPVQTSKDGVEVKVATFSREEIKEYFASDLAKKEVWPMRLSIKNNSNKNYLFTKGLIQPNRLASHEASREGKRGAGWRLTVGLILFISFFGIPLAIPFIVGGCQALSANSYMSKRYQEWEIQDTKLTPGTAANGIVFFQKTTPPHEFVVTLLEDETDQRLEIPVTLQ